MKSTKFFTVQIFLIVFAILGIQKGISQSEIIEVETFNKVIVSPHIEVIFKEGNEESVSIESNTESMDKLNIEVKGKTLRIYLDDAKMVTKSEKVDYNEWKKKESIYKGTVVRAVVTYINIEELSLRGEEEFKCESLLKMDKFVLSIYGDSKVHLNEVDFKKLKTTIYGESKLLIQQGEIDNQKYTVYGESKVNTIDVKNKNTKLTAYGESEFKVNVSERLKVTAYGEAEVYYKGNPTINKGIIIGEARIQSIE